MENVRSGKDSVENNVKKACEKSSHRSQTVDKALLLQGFAIVGTAFLI